MKAVPALLIALALAGCAAVKEVSPGPYSAGKGQTVVLGRTWSDITGILVRKPKHVRLLSVDGPWLNRLYVSGALEPGDVLVREMAKEQPTPTVRADMTPSEKIELIADTVATEYQRVETLNPRPVSLPGGVEAVRFDIEAQTSEGLNIADMAQVAERGGKLYVLLYLAPAEHYYGALLPEVERVMASAQISG